MRVQADPQSAVHHVGPIHQWSPSLSQDPAHPDSPWSHQDQAHVLAAALSAAHQAQHPSLDLQQPGTPQPGQAPPLPPFPVHVDPALNPHAQDLPLQDQPPNQPGDQSPYSLAPAYSSTRSHRSRGSSGNSAISRARTDLLSPNAAALFRAATAPAHDPDNPPSPSSPNSSSAGGVPRLPPILQVEKQTVTTTATQAASASRRRNEAMYQCPVPGCGSTFTRRFNLRGHLRSHTEERPYVCDWPGCGKGFARQHDCKRHYALHSPRPTASHLCHGCGKTFSRTDALNRHLRSDNGAECRPLHTAITQAGPVGTQGPDMQNPHLLMPVLDGLAGPSQQGMNGHETGTPNGSVSPAGGRSPQRG